ncbi:tRNA uridine-5-carboxymethylaminomethyl(34) synthesis GTPase MnmE [Falsiroseomonas tokyonensis]|uniref:tRNA modification GTPase MnmE n=1 Tax=Falsiroseomonas tokyonensis TaxID=430521 RepID=A0ABV7BPE5_9PROT|nr:tRNA uridine-5-carboxymethylaminomethyl(34) synthesis GTPase MnmE [Falsiroseomonas tokyonensis]MBU8536912.1 tRNA uridine-5-carboxymethylaminomethyl(34) synthesis GTPase MnmE [Falsiroseomonas tokyonensis]
MTDTILARASGAGQAAVTVLRLSGPQAGAMLQTLAGRLPEPRRASLRRLRDAAGEVLDQALVLWFPGPASYTGEDAAELHLHGGSAVVAAVEAALLRLGGRPAEPGEFTRRAFLHGRMDLTQAEAVADLIAAETEQQRRQALRQAEGALATLYGGWSVRLTRILAQQEAAIEFEMDDLPSDLSELARQGAAALRGELAAHLDDGGRGERLREGLSIAILGAPNAGKSSLLNALAGRDAAIVAAQPGTTRDIVECRLVLGGVPVVLADTAGLRQTEDAVEQEGVRRATRRAGEADLLLLAFACDAPPDAESLALLEAAPAALVLATKCDLAPPPPRIAGREVLATSTRTGQGLESLRDALAAHAQQHASLGDAPALTRARHRAALTEAASHLAEAETARLPELAAENFRAALNALGRLTGRVEVEQILDAIFRDFCIGK